MSSRSERRARGRTAPRAAAVALGLALALPALAAESGLRGVPLDELQRQVETSARLTLGARGLEIEVDGSHAFALPFAAEELELDVETAGYVLLTWASRAGERVRPFGPPWRYTRVPAERATLRLDLRITEDWSPRAQPILVLSGGGRVIVHAMRMRPPAAGDVRGARDRALLWAPESIGHTTINTLTPSFWSASRGIWLADAIAAACAAAVALALLVSWLRGRRVRAGVAVAAASLAALAAWDVHFLARFLPMANLRLEPDREARLRENVYVAPEAGALVALARATLGPDERVGSLGREADWFTAQAICFYLQPRRCAILRPGAHEHAGVSGVGRLTNDEVDAIVAYNAERLPAGFVPVAAVSPHAIVARRR